jgi:hypothetical protein
VAALDSFSAAADPNKQTASLLISTDVLSTPVSSTEDSRDQGNILDELGGLADAFHHAFLPLAPSAPSLLEMKEDVSDPPLLVTMEMAAPSAFAETNPDDGPLPLLSSQKTPEKLALSLPPTPPPTPPHQHEKLLPLPVLDEVKSQPSSETSDALPCQQISSQDIKSDSSPPETSQIVARLPRSRTLPIQIPHVAKTAPTDLALALQLDPVWMVQFLVAVVGWMSIIVASRQPNVGLRGERMAGVST